MPISGHSLTDRILSRAQELGFDRAGVAPAEPMPNGDAYQRWIDAGHHGQMAYLARDPAARADPSRLLQGARSIVALAASYRVEEVQAEPGQVARYALGYDYHKVLETRLAQLGAFIRMECGADVRMKSAVDRLPLLERDVAHLAGLGWYGKNTLIMNRQQGSYLFLAELLVDVDLSVNTQIVPDFCGSCTACMDACPTKAFPSPHTLDARRCIAYLTIELRGPIPRELRPLIGDHLFGCDICQRVCPWNRKAPVTTHFPFLGRPEIQGLTADQLLEFEPRVFHLYMAQSPLQRPKRTGLLRNAAVVLGNTGDRRWVALLARRLGLEPDPLVRGHIAWALGHLGGTHALAALDKSLQGEDDPYVQEELRAALNQESP